MKASDEIFHIHFETRSSKPAVFRFTEDLIAGAMVRNGLDRDKANRTATTLGSDLSDLSWLSDAQALVTSNDVIVDPGFPRQALEKARAPPKVDTYHRGGNRTAPAIGLAAAAGHFNKQQWRSLR